MSIQSIFFIDIETIPAFSHLPHICHPIGHLFRKRMDYLISQPGNDANDIYQKHAGIYAEFGKIISISIGKLQGTKLYIKTITTDDEKVLLNQFKDAISQAPILCAHNGKEFDFPYLFRRFIINNIPVPAILNRMNKKMWDPGLEDTMELWGGTQWKYKCSIELLTYILGIDSPKDEMSGADVASIYYDAVIESEDPKIIQEAFAKIGKYNAKDVVAGVNVYARLKDVPSYTEIVYT